MPGEHVSAVLKSQTSRKKVLLLNPPGTKLFVRDYYCSKVSKGNYLYHPVDLLVNSGWLATEFELTVLDCIIDRLSPEKALRKIGAIKPDAIFFLTGSVSLREDFPFLAAVKAALGPLMIGSGDYLLGNFDTLKKQAPWLDAIVLDFVSDDLLNFLKNVLLGKNSNWQNIVDLRPDQPQHSGRRERGANIEIPIPSYELFPNNKYRYPFVRSRPFATVLTDYGCPYRCQFCVQVALGFKLRTVKNVMAELDYLKTLGFRAIYFTDQTFGYKKRRMVELCQQMIERKYNFSWVAFSRADLIDRQTLELLKASGCHMLMFGVESPIQRVLDQQQKDLTVEQIRQCFRLCREAGIKTLATFIIGLPGTSYQENLAILDFALELQTTYASFNVLIPRIATTIRNEAVANDWIVDSSGEMDQSGTFSVMNSDQLSVKQIQDLRKIITRGFYFRPRYLLQRLRELETVYELQSAIGNGIGILRNLMAKGAAAP